MIFAYLATAVVAATILLGLSLFGFRLAGRRPPRAVGWMHPALGISAIVLLYVTAFAWPGPHSLPFDAGTLVLTLTFVGGGLLLALRLNRLPRPLFVILVHGAAALLGGALLVVGLLR